MKVIFIHRQSTLIFLKRGTLGRERSTGNVISAVTIVGLWRVTRNGYQHSYASPSPPGGSEAERRPALRMWISLSYASSNQDLGQIAQSSQTFVSSVKWEEKATLPVQDQRWGLWIQGKGSTFLFLFPRPHDFRKDELKAAPSGARVISQLLGRLWQENFKSGDCLGYTVRQPGKFSKNLFQNN